ncbi:DUF6714 family protein [Pseudomonas sp. NPDC089401]|uniref:DUF6714 family protein n=1 Tax=Pseudomonas sp. NPDC089401 TaxID=3364462 RepID=UPI0037FBD165
MRGKNTLNKSQIEIRLKVERAFGNKPPPPAEEIINTKYIEPIRIRDFFKGKPWWEITLEKLQTDYSGDGSACLTFMSPKGRNYYLPAYLLLTTESYYEGDVVTLDFPSRLLMYAKDDDYFEITGLKNEEMVAIAEVLRFLVTEHDDEDAQEALDFLWKQYLPQPPHNPP